MTEENRKLGQCPFFETRVSIHHWNSRVFRHVPEKGCADTGTVTQRPGVQAPEPVQKTLEGVADFCNNAGHADNRLNSRVKTLNPGKLLPIGCSAASTIRLSVRGEELPLKFIHITDSHVGETVDTLLHLYASGRALSAALAHIARHDGHGAAFIAHTGDMICTSSRPDSYEGARAIYGLEGDAPAPGPLVSRAHGLDLPWYYIPGNADDRDACRARIFPRGPRHGLFNYSWEVGGVRFLSLDWGAWKTDVYTLEPSAFAWLETQLQQSVPTIILTHHPPVHVGVEMFDRMTPEDLPRLQNLIRDSSVTAVFHGHTHYPWETRIEHVPVFGTGSITYRLSYDEGPPHLKLFPPQYRVVTVKDDGSVSTEVWELESPV